MISAVRSIVSQTDEPGLNDLLESSVLPLAEVQDPVTFSDFTQHGQCGSSVHGPTWSFPDGAQPVIEIDLGSIENWESSDLLPSVSPIGGSLNATVPSQGGATLGPSPGASPASTTNNTHDCEARAISILCSLQHGEMHPGATSCSTNPTRYADLNLTPSFDRVLSVNKDALDGWSKLMECSCASCPHLLILYLSILSKMAFWYGIAATERSQPPVNTEASTKAPNSSKGTMSSPSLRYPPTVDQFSVRPTRIQVGILSLDAEDQANLRRILLLRELRRAKMAIDELMRVDRSALQEANEAVRRSVQWSLGGITRVEEELKDMIERVSQLR
ncbi:hypothetical protein NUW58_g758 [Xylaria curta]|uniref:Uncharacterized protein n=2 Tax=Xylaria curta TaxID=42375 RepID=A0ACC1PP74_9PEZI|nr:hypothetical protein NUW58_g2865 [Xylaria curta]KAJ2997129.1 hypothetical protein NUW58_g758 [Xylaria curta]